jgi:hypothetical protein
VQRRGRADESCHLGDAMIARRRILALVFLFTELRSVNNHSGPARINIHFGVVAASFMPLGLTP